MLEISIIFCFIPLNSIAAARLYIHMAQCTSPQQYFLSLISSLNSQAAWNRSGFFIECAWLLQDAIFVSPRRQWQQHQQQFVWIWNGRKVKWSICEFKAITSAGWQQERPKKFALSSIKQSHIREICQDINRISTQAMMSKSSYLSLFNEPCYPTN